VIRDESGLMCFVRKTKAEGTWFTLGIHKRAQVDVGMCVGDLLSRSMNTLENCSEGLVPLKDKCGGDISCKQADGVLDLFELPAIAIQPNPDIFVGRET